MSIIDCHCHILSPDISRYPRAPLGGKQSVWATERPVTAEQLIDRMDEAEVDRAVLVQATTAYGYDNSYVLDSAQRFPDRFVAVGTFDPLDAEAAKRLAQGIDAGLSGVRLFTTGSTVSGQGMWFADEKADEFWAATAEARLPVCLQLRLGPETIPALSGLLQRHPDAMVLLDHCGYPDVGSSPSEAAAQLTPLAAFPGLHLKLTHRTLEPLHVLGEAASEFLAPVLEAFGHERIAWGSNCPAAEQPLPELVTLAADVLSLVGPQEREGILETTTRRLYPGLAVS